MPLYNSSTTEVIVASSVCNTAIRNTIPVPVAVNTPVVLAAANAARKGLLLTNKSTGNVFIELGAAPTVDSYAVPLKPNDYYELPFGYTGQVQGMWDALGGTGMLVRELVLV